ncbi:MAG: 30S ribosomal protein S3 [Candidatus Aenigmatarchaeota archaeon]
MKERLFIKKAKEQIQIEEFVRKEFASAKCGDVIVNYTPLGVRVVISTVAPGLVIGAGGGRIKEVVDILKTKYGVENPQIDVQKITNPDIHPVIVAQSIAAALEKNVNFRRLGKYYLERTMKAGAIGCEIVMSGKISGERGRKERFIAGYLKKCGEPALRDVEKGFAVANPPLGNIGILVKIMVRHSDKRIIVTKPEVPVVLEEITESDVGAKKKRGRKNKEEDTEPVRTEEIEGVGKVEDPHIEIAGETVG